MKPKRLTAFLLSVAMILSLMPTFTLTASADESGTPTTTTEKNITLGTTIIRNPTEITNTSGKYYSPNSYIYFGMDGETPIKWRVLDSNKANDKTTDGIFLFSEYLLQHIVQFDADATSTNAGNNSYQGSDLQKWCIEFANSTSNFSSPEQSVMFGIDKTDTAVTLLDYEWEASELKEKDKIFALSVPELTEYIGNYNNAPGFRPSNTLVTKPPLSFQKQRSTSGAYLRL